MAKFVAIVTFGDLEKRDEARPAHRAYLQQLLNEGKLHESGPWVDDSGACLIYEAANEAEVRAIIAADPYAAAEGVVANLELREWNRVFPA